MLIQASITSAEGDMGNIGFVRFMQHEFDIWIFFFHCGRTAAYQHNHLFHPVKKESNSQKGHVHSVGIDFKQISSQYNVVQYL